MPDTSAFSVVQAQLDAYNAKDIEALLRTYAPDAQHFTLHGGLLAQGHVEMLCIYEVADGLIQRASFALGEKTLLVRP
jgi:hypothetical protein